MEAYCSSPVIRGSIDLLDYEQFGLAVRISHVICATCGARYFPKQAEPGSLLHILPGEDDFTYTVERRWVS